MVELPGLPVPALCCFHLGTTRAGRGLGRVKFTLRIGIGDPREVPQQQYVLDRFPPDQAELIEPALKDGVGAAVCWVHDGIIQAMNRFNRRNSAA